MLLSLLFSVTSSVPATRRRMAARGYGQAVQRTALENQQYERDSALSAPLAGTQGGVYGRAVATPVFAGLRPPNTSCTPIVASGVATALDFLKIHYAEERS